MSFQATHFTARPVVALSFSFRKQEIRIILVTLLCTGLAIPARCMAQSKLPSKEWIDSRVTAGISNAVTVCRIQERKENLEQASMDHYRNLSKKGLSLAFAQTIEVLELTPFLYEKINKATCDWEPGYLEAGIGTWLRSNGWIKD
jgi:hypothetical protein